MKSSVRILLLGDSGVGKSSMITSLIRDQFVENVERVVAEVTVPPEVTPEKVTTHIVDSAADDEEMLPVRIRQSDVICIVYDVERKETFDRIESHWLPLIHKETAERDPEGTRALIPVILVGNKIDMRGSDIVNRDLENNVMPIMVKYSEVETCVECSAKSMLNLSEVFYFAQKSVLHPTAPLYDTRTHTLTDPCIAAISRIFKLCDRDCDGLLSDTELNDFQRRCFNAPLQTQELEGVKDVVKQNTEDGLRNGYLTQDGFLYLHKLFVQRGRLETTWAVLRKFGYGDDLQLSQDFLSPKIEIRADETVELGSSSIHFLTQLFRSFDKDRDSALSSEELTALFSAVPPSLIKDMEFTAGVASNNQGWVTLEGFLAAWVLFTLEHPVNALGSFACLGYPDDDITSAVKVTRSKKIDFKKQRTTRTVFMAYVVGAKGSGKSTLLNMLLGKPQSPSAPLNSTSGNGETVAVNGVSVNGAEKYLVLREFAANGSDVDMIRNQQALENKCDVVVFLYDASDPNSFEYVVNLQSVMASSQVPIVFVATKADLPSVTQDCEYQPEEYTKMLDIPPPVQISHLDDDISESSAALVAVAINPHLNIPASDVDSGIDVVTVVKIGLVCSAIAAVGFVLMRTAMR